MWAWILKIGLYLAELFLKNENVRRKKKEELLAWVEKKSVTAKLALDSKLAFEEAFLELEKEKLEAMKTPSSDVPADPSPPAYYEAARLELGTKEIAGLEDNPRIVEYLRTTTLESQKLSDEIPWCSAFVNWCLLRCGIPGTNSPTARSWLRWGRPVTEPYIGAVTVLKRGIEPWQGHVGFYAGEINNQILVLGGNQGNSVSIRGFPKSSLIAFRGPPQGAELDPYLESSLP